MKTLKTLIALAIVIGISGILPQCKKSNDNKPSCQIITVTPLPNGNPLHFTYNQDGNPSQEVSGNLIMTFEYLTDSVIVRATNTGNFQYKTIAELNNDGLATHVRIELDSLGTTWQNTVYEYNGQELSKSTFTSSNGRAPVVSTYSWNNQNLVKIITDTITQTFGYYLDRPRQTGDYFLLTNDLQGFEIYRNKNLLKTIDATSLNYTFGTDGKIISLSATTGANENFLNYEYQCN
jgi:hypothetical protein